MQGPIIVPVLALQNSQSSKPGTIIPSDGPTSDRSAFRGLKENVAQNKIPVNPAG